MNLTPSQPRGIYNSLLIEKEENANTIQHLQNIINDSKTELSELQKQIKANKYIYKELKAKSDKAKADKVKYQSQIGK